ncbi:MAG: hypothetical protein KGM47_12490 [Acidobacteriota bacterium]|nr:hypothetical protein [Acidobacteriota bacterium]
MAATKKLVMPIPKAAIAFRPEYFDFRRGIHVGNLEDNARITRILKLELEFLFGEPFVTERYGRGVYWQWIGYLSRSNRAAKPISSHVSFGCSKFFLMVDTEQKLFKCGLQVERGLLKAESAGSKFRQRPDWDWHRLMMGLKRGHALEHELTRLRENEGFAIRGGSWDQITSFSGRNWPGIRKFRKFLEYAPADEWVAFQLYYPMSKAEIKGADGAELIEAIMAVFREVTPAMNLCMQTQIRERSQDGSRI